MSSLMPNCALCEVLENYHSKSACIVYLQILKLYQFLILSTNLRDYLHCFCRRFLDDCQAAETPSYVKFIKELWSRNDEILSDLRASYFPLAFICLWRSGLFCYWSLDCTAVVGRCRNRSTLTQKWIRTWSGRFLYSGRPGGQTRVLLILQHWEFGPEIAPETCKSWAGVQCRPITM